MNDEISPPHAPRPAPPAAVAKNPPHVDAAPAVAQPGAVAAAGGQPPALFGGHRGGGKKRLDGLPAGSPEARAVDREKNRLRMASVRAAQKVAALPPPLPGVASPVANAPDALAAGQLAVPGVAGLAPDAAVVGAMPAFVAWSEKLLGRPVKLLTKIADRLRVASLMQRVRKLGLSRAQELEIAADLRYKQEAVDDFNAALTNCLVVELNKHRVYGAEHGHYVELLLTGGELVHTHLVAVDKLEQFIAEQRKKEAEEKTAAARN